MGIGKLLDVSRCEFAALLTGLMHHTVPSCRSCAWRIAAVPRGQMEAPLPWGLGNWSQSMRSVVLAQACG